MPYEPVIMDDPEQAYEEYHARWRRSHGDVVVFIRNETVAFTPPRVPMAQARVALITTGGVHLASQPPYDMRSRIGDLTLRFIPAEAPCADLLFTHDHYDHTHADADPNCMFPLEHLRDFAREGVIGSVAPTHVGGSGWIPRPEAFLRDAVPQIAERFRSEGVDVALFTGG